LFDLDLAGVWRYRELMWFLVLRDVKVRYKQAALGMAWAVVQPLFTVVIFTLIFGYFARFPSQGLPYPLFAFAAMLPWTYFSEAARRSSLGLVGDSTLISKIYFPRLVVPIANVITPVADFFVALLVFCAALLWYGYVPGWQILLIPFLLMISVLLALAVGLWLGPINVKYRDVTHTLPFLLQLWMYATPIIYPLSMVPERWHTLYSLNPMVGVVEGFRWVLLDQGNPDFRAMALSVGIILIVLAGGLVFFRQSERQFADIL
jgi:lipopolysaccharide transport system permease protein